MPSEQQIHLELQSFGPRIIDVLDSVDFWDLEGEYDPMEVQTEMRSQPEYKRYVAESKQKNSRVWGLVKALFIGGAISAGISQIQKDYKPQIARQVAKDEVKYRGVVPAKPTAKDYMDQYIKEHGGEYITKMSRADQNLLTRFLWKNSGEHERPLAKAILKNERSLAYLVDNSEARLRAIKRTETGRATAYGAKEYAREWGAKTKTRHSAFAKNSRESHKAISGEEVPIDKAYSNGEMFCKENSINCLCWDTFNF